MAPVLYCSLAPVAQLSGADLAPVTQVPGLPPDSVSLALELGPISNTTLHLQLQCSAVQCSAVYCNVLQ